MNAIHTSDIRCYNCWWLSVGGTIVPILATGEVRYCHPRIHHPVRINGRRKDVPKKLLSLLNQVLRSIGKTEYAANDPDFDLPNNRG